MSLAGAYDEGNVFARILRGEIPVVTLWEDADVLAFLDAFPQTRGHALVISKTSKARNLLEVEPDALGKLASAAQRVARALDETLRPDGLILKQFNGAPAGQTVFHLHFHVVPVWDGQPIGDHGGEMANIANLESLAATVRKAL